MGLKENLKGQLTIPEGITNDEEIKKYLSRLGIKDQVIKLLEKPQPAQRTPEWFAARKGKITGSIIDSILGRSKYKSRTEVLMSKFGVGEKFTGNAATKHGEKYEDEAIELFCEKMGMKNLEFGLLPHPSIEYLSGSPDGITWCGKVLEVKCPMYRKIQMGEVPQHYLAQIYINMEIAELDEGYFIEYAPTCITKTDEHLLNIVHIKRDPHWLNSIKKDLDDFYNDYKLYNQIGITNHPEYQKHVIKIPECDVFPEKHEHRFPKLIEEEEEEGELLGSQDTVGTYSIGNYSYDSFLVPSDDEEEEDESNSDSSEEKKVEVDLSIEGMDFSEALLKILVNKANETIASNQEEEQEESDRESLLNKNTAYSEVFGNKPYDSADDSDFSNYSVNDYDSESLSGGDSDEENVAEPDTKKTKYS